MLRRLQPPGIQSALVIGAFVLTAAVFLFFFIRALRMKKDHAEYMSLLPVQQDNAPSSEHENT